jgi:Cysteine rich repeat
MKMLTCIAALGGAMLLSISAGYAAPSAIAETCKADVKQFCADVKPGAGKLTACIKSHFKDLSGDCQVAFIRVAAVGRDCKSDIKSFCSDAKSKTAVPACLKAHAESLSASCKDAMTKAQAGDK